MNKQALFVASCISLVTTSMVFSIRGDIEPAMSEAFHLTKEQMGLIWGPAFWGFTIAIFICGALVDVLGMRSLHILSAVGYIAGVLMVILSPRPQGPVENIYSTPGTLVLYIGFLIMGLCQGIVEGVINPLVATMYREEKTHKLNVLHAFWPGGLVIGGLLAYGMTQFGVGWQIKLGTILVPAVIYLLMAIGQKYPQTERVTSNVSTGEMWAQVAKPFFLLMFVCMWLTAASELAPDQWFPSLMKDLTGIDGILFLVYSAGLMFVLRFFGGAVVHKFSPFVALTVCSVLTAAGLFWLGNLKPGDSAVMAFAAATVFGIGKTFYWPTMLGIVSEQFPKGGALLINLMGGAGMLAVAVALPQIGKMFENTGAGSAMQTMAILPTVLIFVFGALYLYFQSKGGYRAIKLPVEEGTKH